MNRGFTLLELLVTLAILVGMTVIAIPWLGGAGGVVELKSEARNLAAVLRRSQADAVRLNRDVVVIIDVDNRSFVTGDGGFNHQFPMDVDVTFQGARSEIQSASTGRIRFFASGGATGGRVSLSRKNQTQDVTVDWLTGGVSVAR